MGSFSDGFAEALAKPENVVDNRCDDLKNPEEWEVFLGRCLSKWDNVTPVIPVYPAGNIPYAGVLDESDPLKYNIVFNDQYFMLSTELNLLNMLLLSQA